MSGKYSVEMNGINKSFGGVHALKNVSVRFCPGEIHSLVGENGAGKSTLIKILSGMYVKDSGELRIHGETVHAKSVFEMKQKGVDVIYQEFALAPDCTVAENIYMSHLAGANRHFINWKQLNRRTKELIESIGFDIDPRETVGDLSVAYQQIVEIAKALSADVDILVLDEPTAVLSPYETEKLFKILKDLREKGMTIIYISHRMEDVLELSDRITVLRDGENVAEYKKGEADVSELVKMMMGRDPGAFYPRREHVKIGEEVFRAEGLNRGVRVQDVSFFVRSGEVLGIAGLLGGGKTESVRIAYGADPGRCGGIYIEGKPCKINSPYAAQRQGINYLSESRKDDGVLLELSIMENITLSNMRAVQKGIFIDRKKEFRTVKGLAEKFTVKCRDVRDPVSSLSGGNQQKVSIAKSLFAPTKVLILDEPTRGIDVGAKVEVYHIINELAAQGMAVILVSSEIEEITGMCDRVVVMGAGTVRGELKGNEITKQRILELSAAEAGGGH